MKPPKSIIAAIGVFYFVLQHFQRERLTALNDRITSRLLTDYRIKLRGRQTRPLASLSEAKSKPALVANRSHDPRRLSEDNNPIAEIQDPKVNLDKKKVMFPVDVRRRNSVIWYNQ